MILSSHNNPILAAFRRDLKESGEPTADFARDWCALLGRGRSAFTLGAGKRVQGHAYKVLTRLATNRPDGSAER